MYLEELLVFYNNKKIIFFNYQLLELEHFALRTIDFTIYFVLQVPINIRLLTNKYWFLSKLMKNSAKCTWLIIKGQNV